MDKKQLEFFRKFGVEVRRLRLEKGLTLEDMEQYGFSAQHFQKIESGKKAVSFYTVLRAARAFKISLAELTKNLG